MVHQEASSLAVPVLIHMPHPSQAQIEHLHPQMGSFMLGPSLVRLQQRPVFRSLLPTGPPQMQHTTKKKSSKKYPIS